MRLFSAAAAVLLLQVPHTSGYQVWFDGNTFTDWAHASVFSGATGAWANVEPEIHSISSNVISEEELNISPQYGLCRAYRSRFGSNVFAAMIYWETGAECDANRCTIASDADVLQAAGVCGSGIIVLTRAYWSSDQWQSRLAHALDNSQVWGAALEYEISGGSQRSDIGEFVKYVTSRNKAAFLLWPARQPYLQLVQNELQHFESQGVNIHDYRLNLVVGNYDKLIPWVGPGDTVQTTWDYLLGHKAFSGARNDTLPLSGNVTSALIV